jgi:TetR/AcrR family transcriptional repressor of bet genes
MGCLSPEQANRLADAVVAAVDGVGARATLEPEHWPASRQRETLATLLKPLLRPLDDANLS